MRIGSPVQIAPHLAQCGDLTLHIGKIFRVISFDDDNRVSIHSIGGDPRRPTMILGMAKSELVVLNVGPA